MKRILLTAAIMLNIVQINAMDTQQPNAAVCLFTTEPFKQISGEDSRKTDARLDASPHDHDFPFFMLCDSCNCRLFSFETLSAEEKERLETALDAIVKEDAARAYHDLGRMFFVKEQINSGTVRSYMPKAVADQLKIIRPVYEFSNHLQLINLRGDICRLSSNHIFTSDYPGVIFELPISRADFTLIYPIICKILDNELIEKLCCFPSALFEQEVAARGIVESCLSDEIKHDNARLTCIFRSAQKLGISCIQSCLRRHLVRMSGYDNGAIISFNF
jgi:hypothetical protein